MPVRCPRCSRVNPDAAAFCYLDGALLGGPADHADPARRRFPAPFVLPSGRACYSFDELVLACSDDWNAAKQVLHEGALTGFLSGLGRADLARAARTAAADPDADAALDGLIRRLPATVYRPPTASVEPTEVNLGPLPRGRDEVRELTVFNDGMGLLTGTVSSDVEWLLLGPPDAPDRRKLFRARAEATIPFHVPTSRLRASGKPFEGELLIEAGSKRIPVPVRFTVPVVPYPDGVLAGATTPREVAEKAKENPKEAGELFASGAVQRWYQSNGWDYPVREAAASGVAAVQQYFEALGLSRPPKVSVSHDELTLTGPPGERAAGTVQLTTDEKRPLWAAVACDADWLDVREVVYEKRTATVHLGTSSVPDRPGDRLETVVTLTTNGRVTFPVVVRLAIDDAVPDEPKPRSLAWVPVVAAGLGLLALLTWVVLSAVPPEPDVDLNALPTAVALNFQSEPQPDRVGTQEVRVPPSMRFGVTSGGHRLTGDARGETNNTVVRVDGRDAIFGESRRSAGVPVGRWKAIGEAPTLRVRGGRRSVWEYPDERVEVEQTAGLTADQAARIDTCLVVYRVTNRDARAHAVGLRVLLDTYVGDTDGVPFLVPGRDQLIATTLETASVPDFVQALEREDLSDPGTVCRVGLHGPGGPDRVRITGWPSTDFGFRGAFTLWDVPVQSIRFARPYDSAVVLYWDERPLPPGATREMTFTLGLGALSGGGRLALSAGGSFAPGGEFTLAAYVRDPAAGERLTVTVPPEFTLIGGSATAAVPRPAGGSRLSPVTWRVRGGPRAGVFALRVASSAGGEQVQPVRLRVRR